MPAIQASKPAKRLSTVYPHGAWLIRLTRESSGYSWESVHDVTGRTLEGCGQGTLTENLDEAKDQIDQAAMVA